MGIYAIGDIQGCFDELQRLLGRLNFDTTKDRIWFTGDLVERGPKSLETLRIVKQLGDSATLVLGNHDLHLIAIHAGVRKPRKRSSINDILKAPDCDELIHWLRHRQILHHDTELGFTMVHAGLLPQWNLEQAQAFAGELESTLRSDDYLQFMANMYSNHPDQWSDLLQGWERMNVITNAFTRLRYCYADGRMDMRCTSSPGTQPEGLIPWYQMPDRKNRDLNLVCGHWATLGYRTVPGLIALDSGCVWGGSLTAVRLDSELRQPVSVQCAGYA